MRLDRLDMESSFQNHRSLLAVIWLLVFSMLASLTTYHYGTGNHAVIVPFLKFIANNQLFVDDYFIHEQQYYHTFLWDLYALILNRTTISIELLFFVSYLLCMFVSAVAIFCIAEILFKRQDVAYLSVFIQMFYFIHNAGLGDEFLIDHLFKESQAALPLLLISIYLFLKGNYQGSYVLQGLAFLIHPLTTIYVAALLIVPFIWIHRRNQWRKIVIPLVLFLLIAAPLLIRKSLSSPESMHMFSQYGNWVDMLKSRYAGHSFPLSWSIWKYLKAALVMTLFLYSWRIPAIDEKHQIIKMMTFTTFGLWGLGLVFTEVIAFPIFIQLQLFRSYAFISLIAVIYWSNFMIVRLQSNAPLWEKGLILGCTLGLVIYLPSEGSPVISQIGNTPGLLWKNNYVYLILIGLLLMAYWWKYRKTVPMLLTATLLMAISIFFYGRKLKKSGVDMFSQQPPVWVDLQHWANHNSHITDMFIVPPEQRGFRVDSERTIYGDYKDGIQMYFNPEFGNKWKTRMTALGNAQEIKEAELKSNYIKLSGVQFSNIARDFSAVNKSVYVITYKNAQQLDFEPVYENEQFIIYKVK